AVFDSEGDTIDAARGFERAEPCELENVAREPPVLLVVVDDQDQLVGHGDASSSTDATPFGLAATACPPHDRDRAGLPRRGGLASPYVLRLRPRTPQDRGGVARWRATGSRRDGGGARARTGASRLRPGRCAQSAR